ncbi:DUF3265 domain-containing protein [Vibrio vulnificus]|nr:DUF3265 domain-containing protein [Vibrio vulnificus]EKZ9203254.1 DUF3265 domain-containing protein [Vibrio vulnificus]MCA3975274.1 DUF3265 domain-containing protein [Vibrio vulnificus]MCG6294051.1 DUF3265 domain-containing protein [Vibrio vulnificus]NVC71448.1 DUF3265 domain-containing protein [Vibrio vulnificus]RZP54692.1 DUF3265 domain-containing protein [Vibrio vulnificus]
MSHFVLESKTYNKQFKRDSCRVAFLVCIEFCGESGLRKVGLHTCCNGFNCVIHRDGFNFLS